jgi:hypothetical protein
MDVYNLGKVQSTQQGGHGFNIVSVQGHPIVSLAFESKEEAEAAHKAMQPFIAKAKLITAYPPPYPR